MLHTSGNFELVETLRLDESRYWLLPEHQARLQASAAHFGFPFDCAAATGALDAVAQEHPAGLWRVRLTLARSGKLTAHAQPLEATLEPVVFAVCPLPLETAGFDSDFICHKTTRRDHYDARLRTDSGLFDTLLMNEREELTEFTRGNLAIRKDGVWLTPPDGVGLLPGTYRARLLAGGTLVQKSLRLEDLADADEIAFFNGLRGWLRAIWRQD
ncbi:hypothetical protein UC35_13045 [Ramlibacter tataouinensis]|uniref:Aminotransferase class IV n=1 Tax=Ramlibacter tataouinensis TaxID=94132 RepID=A0A127JZP5_9BURK|nr:hypothetical protein UC35_13045 [Ramlibacter tataouinensis]